MYAEREKIMGKENGGKYWSIIILWLRKNNIFGRDWLTGQKIWHWDPPREEILSIFKSIPYLIKSYKKKEKYILAWNCVCVEVPRCLGPAQDVPSPLLCRPQGTNTYFNDSKVSSSVESRVDLDTVRKGLRKFCPPTLNL
jgi:hypothetical protein